MSIKAGPTKNVGAGFLFLKYREKCFTAYSEEIFMELQACKA